MKSKLTVYLAALITLMAFVAAFATDVTFEWTDTTPGGSDGFDLRYVTAGVTNTVSVTTTNATISNMSPGTSIVDVRATATNGLKSAFSAPYSVLVPATPDSIHIKLN